ncbi:MAG: hypothetical protein IJ356_04885 [Erysipelotrichaceae bacterium]|nr:hypothetical protein [Erysipelotrichaceae bacterium]
MGGAVILWMLIVLCCAIWWVVEYIKKQHSGSKEKVHYRSMRAPVASNAELFDAFSKNKKDSTE